jgi:Domain of unknown function (DUF6968)
VELQLGPVIAERRLRVKGHPDLDVRIRIGTPSPFADAPYGDYYCPYQIIGLGSERVRHAGGVDAVQALELAIHVLPTELDALRQEHPGLGWEDAPDGDYGFSKAVSRYVQDGPPRHDDE